MNTARKGKGRGQDRAFESGTRFTALDAELRIPKCVLCGETLNRRRQFFGR